MDSSDSLSSSEPSSTIVHDARPSIKHIRARLNVSTYDRNPFYKGHVIRLRTVLLIFAEVIMGNIIPIIFSFIITLLYYLFLQQRYDHLYIQQFDVFEGGACVIMIYLWNILSQVLINLKLYKIQYVISRIIYLFLLLHSVVFQFRWFVTPGTTCRIGINQVVVAFILWNYLGFGIVVFLCPIPQWLLNFFTIYFCSQLSFYIWTMFTVTAVKIIVIGLAVWELLSMYIPWLIAKEIGDAHGFTYSIFITPHKRLMFGIKTNSESTDDTGTGEPQIDTNESNVKLPKQARIPMRDTDLSELEEAEETIGLNMNFEYGEDALLLLQKGCMKLIECGVHINMVSIMFYEGLLVLVARKMSMIGVLTVFHIIGFTIMIKKGSLLFREKRFPLKLVTFILCEMFTKIIHVMVTPIFKHIALSAYFPDNLIDDFFE